MSMPACNTREALRPEAMTPPTPDMIHTYMRYTRYIHRCDTYIHIRCAHVYIRCAKHMHVILHVKQHDTFMHIHTSDAMHVCNIHQMRYIHTHIHAYTHTYIRTYIHAYIHTYIYICTYIRCSTCICTHTYMQYTYTYTYATHTNMHLR